jgi:hypothetical protein
MRSASRRDGPVRIGGAGPAGLSAALLLAQAGVPVELRERRSFVGARFRDSVHGIENWTSTDEFAERLSAWGLDLGAVLTPCRDLLLCDEGMSRRITFRTPLFYLVVRGPDSGYLEGELLARARAAGAVVKFNETFGAGEMDLDATGPESARRVCVEVGIKFRTRAPNLALGLISRHATPAGYAYLLIHDGRASLCAVRFDGKSVDQRQLEECTRLVRRHVDFDVQSPRPSAGYGTFCLHPEFERGSSWCVGEAAGLQDFVWGFGIRRALESGALAARAWLLGGDYSENARQAFGVPDHASVVNRYLWDRTAALGFRPYVSLLCRRGNARESLRKATRPSLIHRLAYPIVRARLQRRFPHLGL